VRQFALLVQPVMPESAGKLLDLLAIAPENRAFASLGEGGRLQPGTSIPEPQGIFPRYVDPSEGDNAPQGKGSPQKGKKA
jgi:methionyl-tRNA synthetase